MNKLNILTLVTGIVAAFSSLFYFLDFPIPEQFLLYTIGISLISFICFLGIHISLFFAKKSNKQISVYKTFALYDILVALILIAVALGNIYLNNTMVSGLLAAIIIIYIMPIPAVLLVIDIILFFIHIKKEKNQ